ncbi:MAG: glycosyltransferase [Candidatus Micrarchaeota archaeon]
MNEELLRRYVAIAFAILLSVFGLVYMVYVTVSFFTDPFKIFLAYIFITLVLVAGIFNIVGVIYYYQSYFYKERSPQKKLKILPKVALAITSYNESPAMIQQTIRSIKKIEYPKGKLDFFLVDDSTSKRDVAALRNICKKEKIIFLHRGHRENFKAGALNNLLDRLDSDFLAIFDADETLVDTRFLLDNLPYFEADNKLASLQTIKTAKRGSPFANAINETYQFFVKFIQPLRSRDKIAMFQGSAGILNVPIAKKVGGFPNSLTEDTAFSFMADLKGCHSIFINRLYIEGRPIETYSAFITQQYRYSYGNSGLVPLYLKNFWKMESPKRMHYFTQVFGLHYISMVYMLFGILTATFAVLGISEVILSGAAFWEFVPKVQFSDLFPFIVMIVNMLVISKFFFSSIRTGIAAYFLNFAAALVRSRAALSALFSKHADFKVVRKTKIGRNSVIKAIRFTLRESSFSLSLLFFAISAFLHADIIGAIWLFYYSLLFISAPIFSYLRG